MLRFFGRFFRPNSNVDISETVYLIDLKFEVQIVLDHVPFQIEFQVIRINRFRDIDIGSLPEKNNFYSSNGSSPLPDERFYF